MTWCGGGGRAASEILVFPHSSSPRSFWGLKRKLGELVTCLIAPRLAALSHW